MNAYPARLPEFGTNPALAKLGLGAERIAFGLAGVGGAWGPVNQDESLATILHALERGVRVFDTAPAYGSSERLLGRALAEWHGPRPVLSTKVGRLYGHDSHELRYDYSPDGLRDSARRSLATIGVERVDLLFLHEPQLVPVNKRAQVVATLRQLQADGLAARLGLAGGHGEGWDGFVESGAFDVTMLFRRLDPCILAGVAEDLPRLRAAGLATYGASPLHMGLLGARYDEFVRERPDWVWGPQIDRAIQLKSLAGKCGLPLATLAHRFEFSVAELDRVVIGASNRRELDGALADFAAGPLPADVFAEICGPSA